MPGIGGGSSIGSGMDKDMERSMFRDMGMDMDKGMFRDMGKEGK